MFEVVEEGSPIPWYDFVVKKEDDQEEGTLSIMAIRKDKKDLIDQVDAALENGIELTKEPTPSSEWDKEGSDGKSETETA